MGVQVRLWKTTQVKPYTEVTIERQDGEKIVKNDGAIVMTDIYVRVEEGKHERVLPWSSIKQINLMR